MGWPSPAKPRSRLAKARPRPMPARGSPYSYYSCFFYFRGSPHHAARPGSGPCPSLYVQRGFLIFSFLFTFFTFRPFPPGSQVPCRPAQGQAQAQAYVYSGGFLLFSLLLTFFTFRHFPPGSQCLAARPGPGPGPSLHVQQGLLIS